MVTPESVIACVTAAWERESYSPIVDRELRHYCTDDETREAIKQFAGMKWQDIDQSILYQSYPNPFVIGDAALRYYLPAFLISAVRTPGNDWFDLMGYLVDFELRLPKKPNAVERFRSRFDPLTYYQKRAVACFLEYSIQYYSAINERAVLRTKYSIDHYWSPKEDKLRDTGKGA